MAGTTLYALVGGQAFFDELVDRFSERVGDDEVLARIYPTDREPGMRALALFLAQYWGGPAEYSATRGHPRLRMRHAGFRIGVAERDAWLAAMAGAIEDVGAPPDAAAALLAYFADAADWMRNHPGEPAPTPPHARPTGDAPSGARP